MEGVLIRKAILHYVTLHPAKEITLIRMPLILVSTKIQPISSEMGTFIHIHILSNLCRLHWFND